MNGSWLWEKAGDQINWVLRHLARAPVRIGLTIGFVTWFVGGIGFSIFEKDASLADGWYWASVVMPTVGFGDYSPITTLGRGVYQFTWMGGWFATLTVSGGIVGYITAYTVEHFRDTPELADDIDDIKTRLDALRARTSHPKVVQALKEIHEEEEQSG